MPVEKNLPPLAGAAAAPEVAVVDVTALPPPFPREIFRSQLGRSLTRVHRHYPPMAFAAAPRPPAMAAIWRERWSNYFHLED